MRLTAVNINILLWIKFRHVKCLAGKCTVTLGENLAVKFLPMKARGEIGKKFTVVKNTHHTVVKDST